jgi:uncharacterized membrane protein YbhN (UPF0104 family)
LNGGPALEGGRGAAPGPAAPTRAMSSWWRRVLPWVVGVGLFWFMLSKTELGTVAESLRRVNVPRYVAFVVTFGVVNLACDAFAAAVVFRRTAAPVTFGVVAVVRAASYLPQLVNFHVGQAYTAYLLTRVYRAPGVRVAGALLVVYATTLGALVAVPALLLPFSYQALPWLGRTLAGLAACGTGYLVLLALKPQVLARRAGISVPFELGVRGHLALMACRLPHVTVLCVSMWLSFYFFDVTVPLFESFLYIPVILLISTLPLTPQGVGTREFIAIKLLVPFVVTSDGDPKAPIIASGVAWAASTAAVSAVISLLFSRRASKLLGAPPGNPSGAADEAPAPLQSLAFYRAKATGCTLVA